ncbi:hypothetical protein FDP22_23265 (plasmid) [Paroceanicella profunda]|uniref:Uncharacterized protein n=1 Tax=Paroceanicella profunda TaxID=2579971 RepID=A0A5B8FJE3_9RHOB|nr:hypothetical protein [Paroceanicella profunda]QDL94791.1 hypothetical protein FDP22_23265 [Paroceanicella profunda]
MSKTTQLLSVLGEIRGRLDELEEMVRFPDKYVVGMPQGFEDDDVETRTPQAWLDINQHGLTEATRAHPFEMVSGLMQFGCPDPNAVCTFSTFELSNLHQNASETRYGLRANPTGEKNSWFTYELALDEPNLQDYEWLEWIIKVSSDTPVDIFFQIICDGLSEDTRIDVGRRKVNEFSSFQHILLPRQQVEDHNALASERIRLIIGTDGSPVPLNVYALGVYAKRTNSN